MLFSLPVLFVFLSFSVSAQADSLQARKWIVGAGGGGLAAGSLIMLNQLWYANHSSGHFHFFNDASDWLQVDKIGHATTSYYVGMIADHSLRWAGVPGRKSAWIGAGSAWLYLSIVETMDGFSEGWGFSMADMTANTLGSAVYLGQDLLFEKQYMIMKWSYHPTDYARYRPDVLGSNAMESILKDYNGHTYWFSFGLDAVWDKSPEWLALAVGYRADGMLGGTDNPQSYNGADLPHFRRTRHFVLSPDIHLSKIPVKSRFLKSVFTSIGFLKVPLPAIGLSDQGKFEFSPLYF